MRVTDDGGIRTVTFDRPAVKNAFTAATATELIEHLSGLDPTELDVVVLTGEGDAFSAGGDIEAMAEREETAREAYNRVRATLGGVAEAVLTAPVPVVAKVNGDAVGAGMALAAAADFAYAAENARFGAAFVHVGLVPDVGGTFLLPKLIGLRKTKELVFTGDLISATEAADIDLINEAVPDDELDGVVSDCLETLADRPTETIGMAKGAIHENLGRHWREALDHEAQVQAQAYDTRAHEEGVAAFLERQDDAD